MVSSCACAPKAVPPSSERGAPKAELALAFKGAAAVHRLPKSHRLRNGTEFRPIIASKRRESGKYFQVYLRANTLGHARLGIIVGKRQLRKAVHRNLAKRVIREVFRSLQETFDGYDVVVRLRAPLLIRPPSAARQELVSLFEKLQPCRV